jgi:hypothetical protein
MSIHVTKENLKMAGKYFLLLIVPFFAGCTPDQLDKEDYVKWVHEESNGLRSTKEVDRVSFTAQYEPHAYQMLKLNLADSSEAVSVEENETSQSSMCQFTYTITCPNGEDPAKYTCSDDADYQQRLNYLLSDMQQDFTLIAGADTIPCAYYHFERNYHTSPEHHIQLTFSTTTSFADKDMILRFNDQLFGFGPIQHTITSQSLSKIPSLKR